MGRNTGAKGDGIVCRGTVVIDVEACKGCDLCIDACPPGVLSMTEHEVNTRGYRYPVLVAGSSFVLSLVFLRESRHADIDA